MGTGAWFKRNARARLFEFLLLTERAENYCGVLRILNLRNLIRFGPPQ